MTLLALGGLAGCGGDDSGDASPTPSPASSGAVTSSAGTSSQPTSTTSSTSPTSTSPSTAAGSASAQPATGPVLTVATASMHAPDGWEAEDSDPSFASASDRSTAPGGGQVNVTDQEALSSDTVESQAKIDLQYANQTNKLKAVRQPDRTVAGVAGYVLTGGNATYPTWFEFGTVTQGHDVTIVIQFRDKIPEADAQATIESILASITWS